MSKRSRLAWRCRRGTLELDVLLERFLASGYDGLSATRKAAFERLLECEDDELQDYFLNEREPNDGELAEIVRLVLGR